MKCLNFVQIALFIGCTQICFSQSKPEQEIKPYIDVTGTAEQEIIPDEIYIQILLKEQYDNKEKISIAKQEERLIASLKAFNIDISNLYLSDTGADYVRIRWRTKDMLTKKDYTLKVSTAKEVGQVFQSLDNLEIADAYVVKVNHSKLDSLKKDIKIAAMKAAKDKADYLLNAIGAQTGKPLIVQENAAYSNLSVLGNQGGESNVYVDGVNVSGDGEEIQFNKIKIQASIYVKFEIK